MDESQGSTESASHADAEIKSVVLGDNDENRDTEELVEGGHVWKCCGLTMLVLTAAAVAIVALIAASARCAILAIFTIENFRNSYDDSDGLTFTFKSTNDNSHITHAFDLMHSFIQIIHIVEYFALLYGIIGFLLFTRLQKMGYDELNAIYQESSMVLLCRVSCTCVSALLLFGMGLTLFLLSTFTPVGVLTKYTTEILTANITSPELIHVPLNHMYVGISYVSHTCHSVTRIFMVYVTIVIRYAWLYKTRPQLRVHENRNNSFLLCLKLLLKPKWLDDETEIDIEANQLSIREKFATLINHYNSIGQFVAPLHCVFQQWFVMQWVVYFIKIIEDLSVAMNSLVKEKFVETPKEQHVLLFVLTHLVFDLLLFLIPYYCASLFNQYHDNYRERLKKLQNSIFHDQEEGWILQSAQLIPENPKFVFIPSFCGLSIPLSSPGYNLSLVFALFAFIISVMTTL